MEHIKESSDDSDEDRVDGGSAVARPGTKRTLAGTTSTRTGENKGDTSRVQYNALLNEQDNVVAKRHGDRRSDAGGCSAHIRE